MGGEGEPDSRAGRVTGVAGEVGVRARALLTARRDLVRAVVPVQSHFRAWSSRSDRVASVGCAQQFVPSASADDVGVGRARAVQGGKEDIEEGNEHSSKCSRITRVGPAPGNAGRYPVSRLRLSVST